MKLIQQELPNGKIIPRLESSRYDASDIVGRTSQAAADKVGRYELIMIGATRARELKSGHAKKINSTHGSLVTAMLEIEAGLIDREEYLIKAMAPQKPVKG
jgi:hypothetical protein